MNDTKCDQASSFLSDRTDHFPVINWAKRAGKHSCNHIATFIARTFEEHTSRCIAMPRNIMTANFEWTNATHVLFRKSGYWLEIDLKTRFATWLLSAKGCVLKIHNIRWFEACNCGPNLLWSCQAFGTDVRGIVTGIYFSSALHKPINTQTFDGCEFRKAYLICI